jgi:hypothetical protein
MYIDWPLLHHAGCEQQVPKSSTDRPQVFQKIALLIVNKLCITFPLQACNEGFEEQAGLYLPPVLPTMKFQPSQLP